MSSTGGSHDKMKKCVLSLFAVLKCVWASDSVYRKYFNFDRSLSQIHQNGKPQKVL